MKKIFLFMLVAIFLSAGLAVPSAGASAKTPGKLIKGKGLSTIYYVGEDNKRYVFPNDKIYFSWYEDFREVEEIDLRDLQSMQLGGNVHYKPGAVLVKVQTDPKVYAVESDGTLRWIKSEAVARALYGNYWNKLIDDLPDSFFTDYRIGNQIDDEYDYDPAYEIDSYQTFSHCKGWRQKARVSQTYAERKCENLERSINLLQKRLAIWDLNITGFGEDFFNNCVDKINGNFDSDKKIAVCHMEGSGNYHTIYVNKAAARAHLDHGDSLGRCEDDDDYNTDRTAPSISEIKVSAFENKAVITWKTNENANSVIKYSKNPLATANSIETRTNSSMVKSHSMEITGLNSNTTYYFKVESKDAAGNNAVSGQNSFKTKVSDEDSTGPVITNIKASPSSGKAVISWNTDENSNSVVKYSKSQLSSATHLETKTNSSMVKNHSIELSGLENDTVYYYKVESTDSEGNTTVSGQKSFRTLVSDTDKTAPVISSIKASASSTKTSITWSTDENSNSVVKYSTSPIDTANHIQTLTNSSLVKSHKMEITGLATNTTYYYKVESTDSEGNTAVSDQKSFKTLAADPDVTAPVISDISVERTGNSATIAWETSEPAKSKITYASEPFSAATQTSIISYSGLVSDHSVTITGLDSEKKYYYKIESEDASGNKATTDQREFTTL